MVCARLSTEEIELAILLTIVLGFVGLAVILLLGGIVSQAIGAARDARKYPPRGQHFQVRGRRMHLHVQGESGPVVVLEAGMGATSLSWSLVQPRVAQFARVASYDRAGMGWSDLPAEPRTAWQMAADLHELLERAGLFGPYVLACHSFGAYVALSFASLYPGEVAGMVFVDALPPADWKQPNAQQRRVLAIGARYCRIAARLARVGFVRLCLALLSRGSKTMPRLAAGAFGTGVLESSRRIAGEIAKLPRAARSCVRMFWSQPKSFLGLAQHLETLAESAAQAASIGRLGDRPLIVLSGNHNTPEARARQEQLASLSSRGKHLVATGSGHWVHLDQPELVVWAIREVVEACRQGQWPTERALENQEFVN